METNLTIAYKLVLDLLSAYGSPQFAWPIGGKCSLVFSESIYWHSIWVVKPNASCSSLQIQELRGDNTQEIAEKIFLAFKDGSWLESAMCGGKKITVKLGDGTGKPEEFMITCELLGMSIGKES
jgi:hypothetical protein